jgi:hypothetical protein
LQPQTNDLSAEVQQPPAHAPSVHQLLAEAAILFTLRRRQRILSKIVRSWHHKSRLTDISPDSSKIEVIDCSVSSSTVVQSPTLGALLFEKVVEALGKDVKAALRFP